jgi:hypothetical protein
VSGDGATEMEAPQSEDRLRVSDAERQAVVDALSRHTGEGRLRLDEFEERSSLALAATTRGDLKGLLADLPALDGTGESALAWAGAPPPAVLRPARPRPRGRHRTGAQWSPFLFVSLLLSAIWLMSGAGYFWPMWVIVPLGISALCHTGKSRHHDFGPSSPPPA